MLLHAAVVLTVDPLREAGHDGQGACAGRNVKEAIFGGQHGLPIQDFEGAVMGIVT
jgi:hypothetical protein